MHPNVFQSVLAEARGHEIGERLVPDGARRMRLGGEVFKEGAGGVAAQTVRKLGFECALPSGRGVREAPHERWPVLRTRGDHEQSERCDGDERQREAERS